MATRNTDRAVDEARAAYARQEARRRKPPVQKPTPEQRTKVMGEAIAAIRIQRGLDHAVTHDDIRREGFTQAEIDVLGTDAIALAHTIVADAGHGRAA